ncbi:hypothetical protein D9M69_470450 [compost metagenome]
MAVIARRSSSAMDNALPPRTSWVTRSRTWRWRRMRTPSADSLSASTSPTRFPRSAPRTFDHRAISAWSSQSPITGSCTIRSNSSPRSFALRNVVIRPMLDPDARMNSATALSLAPTPALSTAQASHGRSATSSSRLANLGTTKTNKVITASTPLSTRIAGYTSAPVISSRVCLSYSSCRAQSRSAPARSPVSSPAATIWYT